jgi:hemerythrin-like domain-containing protein
MDTLADALEREHKDIDEGIAQYLSDPGRADSLTQAMSALRRHIYLEEQFLFPPLRDAGIIAPIFVMLREHGEMWTTLDALDADLSSPDAAAAVQERGRELVGQLQRHNEKEEAILYSQADSVLTAAASRQLRDFMSAGVVPDGWVCAKAGS